MTAPPDQAATGRSSTARRGWAAAIATVATLAVALGAWLLPDPFGLGPGERTRPEDPLTGEISGAPAARPSPPAAPLATAPAAGGNPLPAPGRVRYLNTIEPVTGRAHLRTLPRPLASRPEYHDHPLAIACPTNQSDDKAAEVAYRLSGDYLDLAGTVRAYAADREHADAPVWVTPVLVNLQADGEPASQDGDRAVATPRTAAPLAAALDGRYELRIRVQCRSPEQLVILVGAYLVPAAA